MSRTIVLAAALGVLLLAVSPASAAWPPQKYRYTGWMSIDGTYAPEHAFSEGDSFLFQFEDRGALKSTRYRLCWSHPNGTAKRCVARVYRYPHISSVRASGPRLHLGRYVARWYVRGRKVASWPFIFSPESTG
jgi:hypothetical protein